MIPRLKRQTKKRHSVKRERWITSRYWSRRFPDQIVVEMAGMSPPFIAVKAPADD